VIGAEQKTLVEQTEMDLEPSIAEMLERKKCAVKTAKPYRALSLDLVRTELTRFLAEQDINATVEKASPLGGGASNEQFIVALAYPTGKRERVVVRVDAVQGVMESDRQREYDTLSFLTSRFPVPEPRWLDHSGLFLGRPFLVTSFVDGVTAPAGSSSSSISGMQTAFAGEL